MASKNPIGKLVETAVGAITHPVGTAGKVVDQARGTVAIGKLVAEQVGRSAVAKVAEVAGLGGAAEPAPESRSANLRAVPEVNEPAHTVEPGGPPVALRQDGPVKTQGDEVARDLNATGQEPDKTTPTMHRSASGPAAKKSVGKSAPVKKTPAKKAPAAKAPAAKAPAVAAPAPAKKTTAKKAPAKQAAAPGDGPDVPTPADVAKVAKKAPAKKSPAKKAAAKQSPAQKTTAQRTTAQKTARTAKKSPPKTAAQVANIEGEDVDTPAGTPGAGRGFNPDTTDTGLQQPDTEPLMDPATVKAVKSESETLRKAADPHKR